jgi:pimeloyl-ACP methyl ester carboxylesterase
MYGVQIGGDNVEATQAGKTHTTPGGLFIDDGGAGGTPVLFVHAAAGSTEQWTAQLAHLRGSGRRALAIDLRGHGRSRPAADGDYTIAAMAGDVIAAADFLGLDRFVLVGHSMGGGVAVQTVGLYPARVAGLLLLDPTSDGRSIPAEQAQQMMAALEGDAYRATIEQYWGPMLAPSTEAVRAGVFDSLSRTVKAAVVEPLRGLLTFDPVTPLSRYPGPMLTVITRYNELPSGYHALVPQLPHRKIDGTGHWLQLDAPDAVNREIDGFLAGVP